MFENCYLHAELRMYVDSCNCFVGSNLRHLIVLEIMPLLTLCACISREEGRCFRSNGRSSAMLHR